MVKLQQALEGLAFIRADILSASKCVEIYEVKLLVEPQSGSYGILRDNPYQNPPPFEKLVGDLSGAYSRRINIQHRLIYQIYEKEKIVKIIRMWTHYE